MLDKQPKVFSSCRLIIWLLKLHEWKNVIIVVVILIMTKVWKSCCSSKSKCVALKRAIVCGFEAGDLQLYLAMLDILGLLGQQNSLDVGQHATLSDGHSAQQLVEVLVF